MKLLLIAGAMALLGCGNGSTPSGSGSGSGSSGSGSSGSALASGSGSNGSGAGSGSGSAATADPRCTTPCRFLADTPLDQVGALVDKTCGTGTWHTAASDCAQLDYQRNCVYAASGLPFKKKRWKDAFANQAWYKPRPDFKTSELSAVAAANVKALKDQAKTCRSAAGSVARADRKRVEAWFAKLGSGKAEIPPIGFMGEDKLSKAELTKTLKDLKLPHKLSGKTPITTGTTGDLSAAVVAAVPGKRKIIHVDLSKPGKDCDASDDVGPNTKGCQVELWLDLIYDAKDKLAAVHIDGAG